MIRPVRDQVDGKQEEYSALAVVDCTGSPDLVDHASRDSTDLNVLMRRFIQYGTAQPLQGRPLQYGFQDTEFDLQAGLEAKRDLRDAYAALPAHVRARYPSPEAFATAALQGELNLDDPDPKRRAGDQPRDRRSSDKTAAEAAAFSAAVEAAVAKRSAAGK